MFCPNCGANAPEGSANCPNCGTSFGNAAATTTPAVNAGTNMSGEKDQRNIALAIILSIVTCGIYPLVMWSRMSVEINMVASRYDGKRTMHFLWMPVIGALTLGIYMLVWLHNLCDRIGNELKRRQVNYKFSAASFWLWNFVYGMVAGAVV